ncbi:MAG TPA: ribonuclease HII [Bacteroidota bacterium]|nr:ribonuclease HII [Bacteroidota bacterium]
MVNFQIEQHLWQSGLRYVCGVDEAGRGPLAGPVVAAAVVFQRDNCLDGLADSKQLSIRERETLYGLIYQRALSIGIGVISHEIIDRINILEATMLAMEEAVSQLSPQPEHLLIDGPYYRSNHIPFTTIIDGDDTSGSVAAASIIAKVTRDRLMVEFDKKYPQYGFNHHKGYGTPEHLEAVKKYGPCEIHRSSFHLPLKRESETTHN